MWISSVFKAISCIFLHLIFGSTAQGRTKNIYILPAFWTLYFICFLPHASRNSVILESRSVNIPHDGPVWDLWIPEVPISSPRGYKAATCKPSEENQFWRKTIHSDCWGSYHCLSGTSLHCGVKAGRKLKWDNQGIVCPGEPWILRGIHPPLCEKEPPPGSRSLCEFIYLLTVLIRSYQFGKHIASPQSWSHKNAHIRLQWQTVDSLRLVNEKGIHFRCYYHTLHAFVSIPPLVYLPLRHWAT